VRDEVELGFKKEVNMHTFQNLVYFDCAEEAVCSAAAASFSSGCMSDSTSCWGIPVVIEPFAWAPDYIHEYK